MYAEVDSAVSERTNFHLSAALGRVYTPHAYGSPAQPVIRGPARTEGLSHQFYVPSTNPHVAAFAQRTGWAASPLFGSTQGYTPFEGIELGCKVKATFLRGGLICENGGKLIKDLRAGLGPKVKIMAPPTNCLSPIGEELIRKGLAKEIGDAAEIWRRQLAVEWLGRELPPEFWFLWLGTVVNRLGGFAVPFLMLYLTAKLQMDAASAALYVSVLGAGSFVAQLVGGEVADRLGRIAQVGIALVAERLGDERDDLSPNACARQRVLERLLDHVPDPARRCRDQGGPDRDRRSASSRLQRHPDARRASLDQQL